MLNESLTESFLKEGFSLVSSLLYIIVGALVGYYVSDKQWKNQRSEQMKSLATGLYHEITEIEKIIDPIIKKENPDSRYNPGKLQSIIGPKQIDLDKFQLYDQLGLYFQFRKEIYIFNNLIVKDLLNFYDNLLSADEFYKIYCKSFPGKPGNTTVYDAQDRFFLHLHEAQKAGLSLKESLKFYVTFDN
jgi:hypothetical protein